MSDQHRVDKPTKKSAQASEKPVNESALRVLAWGRKNRARGHRPKLRRMSGDRIGDPTDGVYLTKMNNKQVAIIGGAVAIIILMGLFPPWTYTLHTSRIQRERPAGYSLIFSPPEPERDAPAFGVRIDVTRLTIQWLLVMFAGGLGVLLVRTKSNRAPPDGPDGGFTASAGNKSGSKLGRNPGTREQFGPTKQLIKVLLWPFGGDFLAFLFCASGVLMIAFLFAIPYVPRWAESVVIYAAILMIVIAIVVSIIKWILGPWEMFDD